MYVLISSCAAYIFTWISRTYFFTGRDPDFVKETDDHKEGNVELDAFHPAGFVRIYSYTPLVELHLLRFHVQDTTCEVEKARTDP